jgi:hypothetical protein
MTPSGKFVEPDFFLVCGTKVASAGPERSESEHSVLRSLVLALTSPSIFLFPRRGV